MYIVCTYMILRNMWIKKVALFYKGKPLIYDIKKFAKWVLPPGYYPITVTLFHISCKTGKS